VTAALLLLLLAPFAGAALVLIVPARGVGAAMGLLALAAALALGLLLRVEADAPVLVAAAWVPTLDLGLSLRGDQPGLAAGAVCLLLGLMVVWRLRARSRPQRPPPGRAALVLVCAGIAQALVLAASLPLLAGGAALGAVAAFGADDGSPAPAFDRAGWVLLVRIAGALALLAAAVLFADATGSAEVDAVLAVAPALRGQPLVALATALLWLGVLSLAGAWPFSRWLWSGGSVTARADALLAAAGVALALRLAPLLPGSMPRIAIVPALLAAPLLAAALGRVLGGIPPSVPARDRRP
jgi:formate hydrogenlyase subunit 3/multisubunit Na+/H+ antiporter MnhD subunit